MNTVCVCTCFAESSARVSDEDVATALAVLEETTARLYDHGLSCDAIIEALVLIAAKLGEANRQ